MMVVLLASLNGSELMNTIDLLTRPCRNTHYDI